MRVSIVVGFDANDVFTPLLLRSSGSFCKRMTPKSVQLNLNFPGKKKILFSRDLYFSHRLPYMFIITSLLLCLFLSSEFGDILTRQIKNYAQQVLDNLINTRTAHNCNLTLLKYQTASKLSCVLAILIKSKGIL